MDGGKNEMSGQGGPNSHGSRVSVPDFAYHNDIRVLSKESFQGTGKIQSDTLLELYLVNSFQGIFNGVFNGGDITGFLVQQLQGGIQRRCFSRTRRAADEHNAVWPFGSFQKIAEVKIGKP